MKIKKELSIILFVFIGLLFLLNIFGIIRFPKFLNKQNSNTEVTLATDKPKYKNGEEIIIRINNNSYSFVYVYSISPEDWSIQQYIENKWSNPEYFQIIDSKIGTTCSFLFYAPPQFPISGLKPKGEITYKWNQRYCQIDSGESVGVVSVLEDGQYRISFRYGLRIYSDKPFDRHSYKLREEKTVYSDSFWVE
jgi:hypothetical protein